jgi:hypothetical protein
MPVESFAVAVSRFPTFYEVSPFPTVALPALCQIGFLINRQGGFCICTMLARVLVYKERRILPASRLKDRSNRYAAELP